MTRAEWGRTLLGALGAMAWLGGPMPLPQQFQPTGHEPDPPVAAGGRARRKWPLAQEA
jgi:hypothetical protein